MSTADHFEEQSPPGGSPRLLIFDAGMIEARDYWRARLSGVEVAAPSSLPLDHPRPQRYEEAYDQVALHLPEPLVTKLNRLTGDGLFLLYTVVLSAVKVCLHKYGGGGDILVGSPRRAQGAHEHDDLERDALVIRQRVSGSMTFKQLLVEVRQALLDGYARQQYPFEHLVEDLGLERPGHRCPLFDVAVTMKGLHGPLSPVRNDVTITLERRDGRIAGSIAYHRQLFRAETLSRFARHLVNVLEQGVSGPDRLVSNLRLLDEDERHRISIGWNRTTVSYPGPPLVTEMFEQQVDRSPEGAVALRCEERELTYRELEAQANRVAHHLRALGVGPDAKVGLCIERSPEMVIGLLGILKAGGAYVPLDPGYPRERLDFMLEDSAVRVLLTQESLLPRLSAAASSEAEVQGEGARPLIVCLDRDAHAIAQRSAERQPTRVSPENLAYVIYTSGSTGKPKGTMIPHRGLTNYLRWCIDAYAATEGEGAPVHSSIAFDLTVTSLFAPLLVGRPVVLVPERGDVEALGEVLRRREGFSLVKLTPAHLDVLSRLLRPEEAAGVTRCFVIGGEALTWEMLAFFRANAPDTRLINEYGPTETVVGCCVYEATADGSPSGVVPIGRPIANTRLYLLDEYLDPVPVGVPGELAIGGVGLARGYLNMPSLTAERFVPDPFASEPGARMYLTGDQARYRDDGTMEFLGRADHQVKIRGYRIELGEIEARLLRHEAVEQAVVLARSFADAAAPSEQDRRLVMYVVSKRPIEASELERHLRTSLPEYMIPRLLVRLDRLPLTSNGKVNRRALPLPMVTGSGAAGSAAPRDIIEARIAKIWRDVLHVDDIGIRDSFFSLGGQSLKATQVISRIHKEFSVQLGWANIFGHPTIEGLAALVRRERPSAFASIDKAPPGEHYALSHAQRRLWVLHRLAPDKSAYNISSASQINGPLHVSALQATLDALARRHESLRTIFVEIDGAPRQVVNEQGRWPLEVVELEGAGAPRDDAWLRERVAAEAAAPFDLERGPLVRAKLFRRGPERHVLVLTMHHIICDGLSIDVLARESHDLFAAFAVGGEAKDARLTPLLIQYKDYAHWQSGRLAGPEGQRDRGHWLSKLASAPPPLDLPADHPRPAVKTFSGSHKRFALDEGAMRALEELGREHGASGFMTCLSLVAVLLYRYTGQDDFILGTPAAGRKHIELESQVGFYVNMLPLRLQLDGLHSFAEVLRRNAAEVKEAYEHEDYPFDRLVDDLALKRDTSRSPLIDVAVALNQAAPSQALPQLATTPLDLPTTTSKFDLTFTFDQHEAGAWSVSIEYSTDLFAPDRIDRMAGHLRELLRGAVRAPDRPIAGMDLLPDWERKRILVDFNATAQPYPSATTIAARFEAQVEKTPDRPAVAFGDRALSYRDVDARANFLARALRHEYGVQPGEPVGVLLDRSERTVIALVAILKAGGAYLPIDPAWPERRVAFMLRDARCRTIIIESAHIAARRGGSLEGVATLDLDARDGLLDKRLPLLGDGGSLAYIAYTSGSTGEPKGALITQRSVLRLVLETNYIDIRADDRILSTGSLAFDASTFEVWGALLNGASVHFAPESTLLDPTPLGRLLASDRITIMFLTTSLFNQLAEADAAMFSKMRVLLSGGEKVSVPHFNRVRDACPDLALLHVYGPTENTTFSTFFPVRERQTTDIPIGGPLANSTLYILDRHDQPVPIGIPGEICAGGDGLALGYLGKPSLTAARFTPSPFGEAHGKGDRLYRTGDIGAWRQDGSVVFIGRLDNQVKVRGFRIEPGEIERRLEQHPAIAQALVVPRKTAVGTLDLVAYFTPRSPVSVDALRAFLSDALPDFMVPAFFVPLQRMPLNTSGKVDRSALPAPLSEGQPDLASPRDEKQRVLAEVFAGVLGDEPFGVDDNLFERGNDSIKSIQVVARLDRQGWKLQIRDVFQFPTIAELARRLQPVKVVNAPASSEAATGEVPLTPIQRWFFGRHGRQAHHFNQDVLLRTDERLDEAALRDVLRAVEDHHDALRMRYEAEPAGDGVVQRYAPPGGTPDVAVVDLRQEGHPAAALERHADETHRRLDLADGPLWRAALYRMPDGDRLLLVIHHLVVDGVSWRILIEDIERAYVQRLAGKLTALGPKSSSFQRWASVLKRWSAQPELLSELPYWSALEQAAAEEREHPFAPPEGAPRNLVAESRSAHTKLSTEETKLLLTGVHHAYHTEANDILLVALGRALKRRGAGERTRITLEGHGREPIALDPSLDVSRTVGWFTSVYPFLLEVLGDDPGAQIKHIKESLRAVPHKGINYGVLRYLKPEPRLCGRPAVSFNYLGQFGGGSEATFFRTAPEPSGLQMAEEIERDHALDVVALVVDGQLSLSITYNGSWHASGEVEALLDAFKQELLSVAAHCAGRRRSEKTPADLTACPFTLGEYGAFLQRHGLLAEDIDDIFPLSPLQEGLLFEALYNPSSTAYCVQIVYRITGDLDPDAFQETWNALTRRHAVLRTAFFHRDLARPLQVVLQARPPEFTREDLRGLPASESSTRIAAYRERDRSRGFDFERDPLMRIALFRLEEGRHVAVWSYHHILLDGWSLGILYRDLARIYLGLTAGQRDDLPKVVPYREYIRWLGGRDQEVARSYWSCLLAGYEKLATVPRSTSPARATTSGAQREHVFALDKERSSRLAKLASDRGTTQNTVVRAIWASVLARYNNTSDVVFGAIVAGRPADLEGVEEMVGPFINAIPVRVQLASDRPFSDVLSALQQQALEGEVHQHLPLAEIQAQSALGRALFDHLLVFENYPMAPDLRGSQGEALSISTEDAFDRTHYPFNVIVTPGDRLSFKLSYDDDHHTAEQVARVAEHLQIAIDQALEDADRPAREIAILPPQEREQVLHGFNQTKASPLHGKTVTALFEEQAAKTPDRLAISLSASDSPGAARRGFTYRALEQRTADLAARLVREYHVGPETHVGVLLAPSAPAIVAVLGVLRAGGAYLPLDPQHPLERIRTVLEDAGCSLCITDRRHAELARSAGAQHIVEIEGLEAVGLEPLGPAAAAPSLPPPRPDALAYTIYTSGSTGQPKGCQIEHRNLAHYLAWAAEFYLADGLEAPCFPLFTPLTFDLTVTSLFLPLITGGSVRVFDAGPDAQLPDILAAIFAEGSGVDGVKLTPSHISLLAALGLRRTSVRLCIVGGEALSVGQIRILAGLNPDLTIYNEYGPTEATVGCVVARVTPDDGRVLIGRPIARTSIYILDHALEPAPIEVAGEIYIGGAGVARGYLRRDALDRERFTESPFTPPGRLYRTGDIGRWLPDGTIEYLGRNDGQIKIRGYRVETGEIEAHLLLHPDVVRAAVVAVPAPGRKRPEEAPSIAAARPYEGHTLIAYVQGGSGATAAALRSFLAQRVPDGMIPSRFVKLDALPLTAHGKVDKPRLPRPEEVASHDGASLAGVAPSTDTERAIARIWTEVLGIEVRGVQDDFFELGGHSLKAMQIMARLHSVLGVRVRLRELFEHPTIAQLAGLVDRAAAPVLPYDAIQPAPEREHYDLSHAQKRLWLVHQLKGERAYNMPEAHMFEGELDSRALRKALVTLIERHEALRTSFIEVDGEPQQRVHRRIDFDLVEIDLSDSPDPRARAREIADREALTTFDLSVPPLLRAMLLKLDPQRHVFLFTMHHIIGDGWSMTVLRNEVLQLYRAFHQGLPDPLAPLRIQYKDFATWQNARDMREVERYWLQKLAGGETLLNLPYDSLPTLEREFRGSYESVALKDETPRALRKVARARKTTLSTVVLTLFKLLLFKLTRREDICVGMGIAGRNHRDIENLIGFFVNVLPIRTRTSDQMEFDELLAAVDRSVGEALEHQDYPVDLLVQKLKPTRYANRQPLFNVVYVFQNFADVNINVDGAPSAARQEADVPEATQVFERSFDTSKFDLTLFASEDAERIYFTLEYDSHLFRPETIRRYLAALEQFAGLVARSHASG